LLRRRKASMVAQIYPSASTSSIRKTAAVLRKFRRR
jgi:hypothetical protein